MRYLLFLFLPMLLMGGAVESPVLRLITPYQAVISIDAIDVGVSGVVLRRFDAGHSTILSRCVVTSFDEETREATLSLLTFDELIQPSLPQGRWGVQEGDNVVLAYGYERALLLAPGDDAYYALTKRITTLDWVHPDTFAAFLSYQGHPSPQSSDIQEFCTMNAVGLLYIYAQEALFTLDCRSLALLEITPTSFPIGTRMLPFHSRIEKIDANWFGEGSDVIEDYDRYYLELIALNNPKNSKLEPYLKSKMSAKSVAFDQNSSEKAP